jgi:LysR family transcriptional regulator for metE and metH
MHLDVRHLELVHMVDEAGSLTRAAERLHLSQSALSHRLRDLEDRLGVPLFERVGKSMRLTPAGRRLLHAARAVLATLHEAEEDLRRIAAGQVGTIRISTECYTCYHWLPAVVETFRKGYSGVEVEIVPEATRRPLDALLAGRLDLAIVCGFPVADERLRYAPLFEDEMMALLRPDHPLAARPFLAPADFAEEHLILYDRRESSVLLRFLNPAGIQPRRVSEVQLTEGIVQMVRAGLGISVLARWAVAPELEAGTLAAVPLAAGGFRRRWLAATRQADHPPAYLEAFVRLLAESPAKVLQFPTAA